MTIGDIYIYKLNIPLNPAKSKCTIVAIQRQTQLQLKEREK